MPFPVMYSMLALIPDGMEVDYDEVRLHAFETEYNTDRGGPSESNALKKFFSGKPVYLYYNATCRESTLYNLQRWYRAYAPIEVNGRMYIEFQLPELTKDPNQFIADAIYWTGANWEEDEDGDDEHDMTVSVKYLPEHSRFVVSFSMINFDLGRISILLFCLSRFPGGISTDEDTFIHQILDNPKESFINNKSQSGFLAPMMGFAMYVSDIPDGFSRYGINPNGYYSLMGSTAGIVDIIKVMAKKHPDIFIDYCTKFNIKLDEIESDLPFSDTMTWTQLKDAIDKVLDNAKSNLDVW